MKKALEKWQEFLLHSDSYNNMETLFFEKTGSIKREKAELEKELGVKITIQGRKITLEGNPMDEYEAGIILDAISFGFKVKIALTLLDEDKIFRKLPMKNFTRRKNLKEVRARVIGTEGKTRRTIENIASCDVVINDNTVGVIGSAESIENATTALSNLIKGSKQANVYRFLERMNAQKITGDLGLKKQDKK